MSTSDFNTVNIMDDRLAVTETLSYGVFNGPQDNTYYQYQATSATQSSINFTVQLPSQQTIIDRRIPIRSTVQLQVTLYNKDAIDQPAMTVLGYGSSAGHIVPSTGAANAVPSRTALAPFPLHQCFSNQTITFNNSSVTVRTRDVLPILMRMQDSRTLQRYNSTTPTMNDSYFNYVDAAGASNDSLASFATSADPDLLPRGSYPVTLQKVVGGVVSALTDADDVPAGQTLIVLLSFETTEPLLVSPLLFADTHVNRQGIYGVAILNAIFNVGDPSRVLRTCLPVVPVGTAIGSVAGLFAMSVAYSSTPFTDTKLLMNLMLPHPSGNLYSKNTLPYVDLPVFITTMPTAIPVPAVGDRNATIPQATNSLQLNGIPDAVCFWVRPQTRTNNTSDCGLVIKSLSLQFNVQSGILASATTQDIFYASCGPSGPSNQNYMEYNGYANATVGSVTATVPTVGSFLMLRFGRDIPLPPYLAPGSLGSFNIQATLNVHNQSGAAAGPGGVAYEIVMMFVQSGIFVTQRGTSAPYLNILSKNDVLDTAQKEPMASGNVGRLVGGGFWNTLSSLAGKAAEIAQPIGSIAKGVLSRSSDPRQQAAAAALGALGAGMSGGHRDRRM